MSSIRAWSVAPALAAVASMAGLAAPVMPPAGAAAPGTGCTVAPPRDTEAGVTTWIGPCRAGVGEGVGVLRVQREFDWSLFFGRAVAGRPFVGAWYVQPSSLVALTRLDGAGNPVSGEDEAANRAAFAVGAVAADRAADRFATAGNIRSRDFYRGIAATLRGATSATGYDAGTAAAHAAATAALRAGLVGRATFDGRPVTSVSPSGHCGTVLGWRGGSHRIEWQAQGNETYVGEGERLRYALNTNRRGNVTLRFPVAAAAPVKNAIGALLWACAPE